MNKNIKFSVIIPVYNTKKDWLDECLDSIFNQTYKNYEIIIVNDGSNQATTEYIKKYKDKVLIINQQNTGVILARLNGLKQASGNYVLFVDSDDFIAHNTLETLNNIITTNDSDVIIMESFRFIQKTGKKLDTDFYFPEGPVEKNEAINQLVQLHINSFADKCCKIELLKSMLDNIDTSIINGEDLQQSTFLLLNAKSIYYTHKELSYYRLNDEHNGIYDVENIHDINFLVPTYKMVFIQTNEYSDLLSLYKQAAINSVIDTIFNICNSNKTKGIKYNLLDELQNQEAVIILRNINIKISFASQAVFNNLLNKRYNILFILAKIFRLIAK